MKKNCKNKRKALSIIAIIVGLALIITGTSYAYFTATATSNEQVVESGTLRLTYETGQDINALSIIPTEESSASIHQFTVENTGTLDAHYNISFIDITLTKKGMDTYSHNLKWALYQADEDYTEGTLVKSGSFSSSSGYLSGDNEFVIKTNMILAPAEKQSYLLKVWLQETGKPQNEDQGLSLAMTMQVDTLEKQEPTSKLSVMRERNDLMSSETFYQYSGSISKVVFQNRMEPIETDLSWDVSENNDGNCMAYLVENEVGSFIPPELPPDTEIQSPETTYTLYIQGNDVIYLSSGLALFSLANLDTWVNILTTIEGLEYVDTSRVTNMMGMFSDCSLLTSLNLSGFDTSQVTNMTAMFSGCNLLTSLNLSEFNTSQVKDMSGIFSNCGSLTSLDLSEFNTSQVTTMGSMFNECSGLTSLDLSHLDTSQVTNMRDMFYSCSKLTNLDLSHFDTSQVTTMGSMFNGCSGLTSLDLSHFDTSQVTDMAFMFSDCSSLTNLDLSHFDTLTVKYMTAMFYNCSNLINLDFRNATFDTVTSYASMFNTVPSTIQIIVKDTSSQSWIQDKLDSGVGTVTIAPTA